MSKPVLLWEVMVPCAYNDGRPVRTKHHQEWDKFVRKVAGGLTIYKPAKGQWIDNSTNNLYAERVIPVRIACTENQIKQIANFTISHYRQLAVLVYVISEKVIIVKADDKIRQNQVANRLDKPNRNCRVRVHKTSGQDK